MIRTATLLVFALFAHSIQAKSPYFDFSPSAKSVYRNTISLRFADAQRGLQTMKNKEQDNLMLPFVENYLDFLTVFVDDDEAAYKRLSKNMAPRLAKIAKGDPKSPYYLYTQAEIRLQWAILGGRFGDMLASLSDIKQAYALLEENQRRFPDFMPNKKSLGVMHALVGAIPDEYKWSIKALGGMTGSVSQGLAELESVLAHARSNPDFVFAEETYVFYAYLQLYLNERDDKAWQTLQSKQLDYKTNPLLTYAIASLAMRIGKNDQAVTLLESCPSGGVYHPFSYRLYLLGVAKLQRLDTDANKPIERFLSEFKGKNAVKEAYQKLAWYHLVNNDINGYQRNIAYVKSKGTNRSEPDKAAMREAESGIVSDVRLMKARLLFDGGYYQRAYDFLQPLASAYAKDARLQLEYTYRLGRITHEMGRNAEAAKLYQETIDKGANQPWYFACNAALQMGQMYEKAGDKSKARSAYERCLGINPPDYAAGLHARAKAGLQRVKR